MLYDVPFALDGIDDLSLILPEPLAACSPVSPLFFCFVLDFISYSSHPLWATYAPLDAFLPTYSDHLQSGVQGAKAQQKRERNATKAANSAKSQIKTNQAAMNIVCSVCRQTFVSSPARRFAAPAP